MTTRDLLEIGWNTRNEGPLIWHWSRDLGVRLICAERAFASCRHQYEYITWSFAPGTRRASVAHIPKVSAIG